MSDIHFKIAPDAPPSEAVAVYSNAEYTLTVGPNGKLLPGMNRLTIDSLTLSFNPAAKKFVGLDAYTNSRLWQHVNLALPVNCQDAALICTETFDENGIAVVTNGDTKYMYCENARLLRIGIKEVAPHVIRCVRAMSCVLCGLGPDNDLAELWIENLRFDRS